MSTLLNIREIQIKTTMTYHLTWVRIAIVKHSTKNKGWIRCGEMRTPLHRCWKVDWEQPLWTQYVCLLSGPLCLTFLEPVDCNLPGSSVHGILQARTLEWVAMPSSRGSSPPRDRTQVSYVSCVGRWIFFYHQCRLGSPWRQCGGSLNNENGNKITIFLST